MFCPKCGQSLPEGALFCPNCGHNASASTEGVYDTPAATPLDNAKKTLSDPLFFAIAILLSVAAGAQLLFASLNILLILTVIGVWMAYAGATGENKGLIGNGITLTSVSAKIEYVLIYVGAGLLVLGGLILFASFTVIGNSLAALSDLTYETLVEELAEMGVTFNASSFVSKIIDTLFYMLGNFSGMVIGLIFFIATALASAIMIVFNLLFIRRFSKHLSGAARACKEHRPAELKNRSLAGWVLAYGIILGIDALSTFGASLNIFALISGGCLSAACVLAFILMRKEA